MRDIAKQLNHLRSQNEGQRAALELFRDAVEHMHLGLCMFDQDGRIALCNNGYAEVLQLPPEKVRPGVTMRQIIELGFEAGHQPPGTTADEIERQLWAHLTSPGTRSTMSRGGRTFAVHPRPTASGNWVATFEDITAQLAGETALRESEARMRAILDAMPDCVKIFAESGELIHINPAGLDLLQAPDLESLAAPGVEPVAPEHLASKAEVHRRVMAGETVRGHYEIVGLKGRRRHVEAHAVPFRLPDGSSAHLCITRDIHERMEALHAQRRSDERLRLVHEATGLAEFEATPHRIDHISPAFREQAGLAPDVTEMSMADWIAIVHPDDRVPLIEAVSRRLAKNEGFEGEYRIVRQDSGEIRWLSSHTRVERDPAGGPSKTIGAHIDITERKRAEEALRESEARLSAILDAMPDCVRIFDETGRLIHINPQGLELLQAPDIESLSSTLGYSPIPPEHFHACVDVHRRVMAGETVVWTCELVGMRGRRRHVEAHAVPFLMPDGTRVHLCISRDVTARKEADDALRRSEERFRLVQEATGLAHFESSIGGLSQLSERFLDQVGLPAGTRSLTRQEWRQIIHTDDRDRFAQAVAKSIEHDDTLECEFRIVRPDNGEIRWLYSRCKIHRDDSGVATVVGAHLDITERKRAEEALRESEERFRLAAEATGLGVWDYDVTSDRREWSDRLRQIFGFAHDLEPSLEAAKACMHPADRPKFVRMLINAREHDIARFEATFRIRRACDGAERWVAANGWRTFRPDSKQRRIILTVRDVTDEKSAEERVRWTASHDPLTRLANRSLFQEKLDHAIRAAASDGGAVGLLLLDLDHFKQINDTLGHDAGDMLLKMFAGRLRGVVRAQDTVARFGGDEFAIVMPDIHTEQSLIQVSRAIQERLREPFVHAGRILDCRVSMGASVFPMHGRSSEALLKNADIALYAAKSSGRGVVCLFEPHMRDDVQRRNSMVQLARNAIRDDRVVPYYQPKFDLGTREIVGFEALLRWRNSQGRIGLPASIEAAFEDLDVAAAISDRMIERVIADMRGWLDKGIEFSHVAVNSSAAEFRRDNFAERVLEQLRDANIPTRCFQLEVTETVFLGRGAEYVHRALAMLSSQGVKIALDDFGTGYASLRHLKQFPVDIIKIDQSFVRDMAVDPNDEAIIRAVINLGSSLGIKVVAEGIETEEQDRRLLELGCDFGQGFLFSRAVAAGRVPRLVESRRIVPARAARRLAGDLRLVTNRD